jgi:hypothetical protein
VPAVVHDVLRSPGQPLDAATRAAMEARFGHDFGRVRVHADARAAESARAVNALAYTVGSDVVFAQGRHAPHTPEGLGLLTHELTHVVQQSREAAPSGAKGLAVGDPDTPAEREADRVSDGIAAGVAAPSPAVHSSPRVLARQGPRPPTKSEEKLEQKLNRMAVFPAEALRAWKGLQPLEQTTVVMKMMGRYGPDFTSEFMEYANGTKKPSISTSITNLTDPKSLKAKGYRLAGTPGGIPVWVHPSGHEVHLLSPPSKGLPPPPPPPDDDTVQKRCVDPCLLDTDDEDACKKCCEEKIPESDVKCRRACLFACEQKL